MREQPKTGLKARHWIDGEWIGSSAEQDSVNPATGEVIGTFSDGGAGEAQAAVDAASGCFETDPWHTSPDEKLAVGSN